MTASSSSTFLDDTHNHKQPRGAWKITAPAYGLAMYQLVATGDSTTSVAAESSSVLPSRTYRRSTRRCYYCPVCVPLLVWRMPLADKLEHALVVASAWFLCDSAGMNISRR